MTKQECIAIEKEIKATLFDLPQDVQQKIREEKDELVKKIAENPLLVITIHWAIVEVGMKEL